MKLKMNYMISNNSNWAKFWFFSESVISDKIPICRIDEDQSNLLEYILIFNNKSRTKIKESNVKQRNIFNRINPLYRGQKLTFNALKRRIFPLKPSQEKKSKLLTPKQKLQRLLIVYAHVKEVSKSEKLLN